MKQLLTFLALLTTVLVFLPLQGTGQNQNPYRTWRDRSGTYEISARLIRISEKEIELERKEDSKAIKVPLEKLSSQDLQYLARRQPKTATTRLTKVTAHTTARETTAGDWPTWRGAARDGISQEKGLLREWPAEGPKVVWENNTLGGGYASVSVVAGKLYTMGRKDGREFIICIDAAKGNTIWETFVGPGSKQRGPNCTPTINDGHVYGLSLDGELMCLNAETGKEVWRRSFSRDFGGRMMSGWGYSESPLIDGDQLICTPGGRQAMMACLDKRTGKTTWTAALPSSGNRGKDGAGYSSIVISQAGGVKQYIQLVGRGVISVSDKGKLLWGYNRIANGTANVPTPVVSGDYVFCSSGYGDGGAALLKVARGGRAAQEVYYKKNSEVQNHHGGMILLDGKIYMGHGHNNGFPLCLDLATGKDVWRPGRGAGKGSAAIAYADGHLYFRYQDGVVALIEATPKGYKLKSKFRESRTKAQTWPQPVIAQKRLYLRDQEILRCYNIASP
ncbi:MAG: PQQ-binding-like beta-propeller repeat protein [Planctomycetota bacterium]|nr:PQQ-binding-like beta-propeller repeat protein [Planctomycetota bacterium]